MARLIVEDNKNWVVLRLTGQLTQELSFVHVVLEGFAAVDKNYRNFVVELMPQLMVAIDVNFLPDEPSTAGELIQTFLDDLAKMTPLARIHDDLAGLLHAAIVPLQTGQNARKKIERGLKPTLAVPAIKPGSKIGQCLRTATNLYKAKPAS
jgi:hypothetical protein